MKEISRAKRQEVAQYYILGYSYEEIMRETGVSHGSVANIIKEVEDGQLAIPGNTFDQVNDLRQLSLDLRKKNLEPSHASLGLMIFERFRALGISPELADKWSDLTKRFVSIDFPVEEFFGAALRLHVLEKTEGRPFEDLAEEYKGVQEGVEKLSKEVSSRLEEKLELSREIEPLSKQIEAMNRAKEKLEVQTEIQDTKVGEFKLKVKEIEEEAARLDKQVKNLERRKIEISAEVDGKEESLIRLNEIGLADEDLLRLRAFLERMSEGEGAMSEQVKERFFTALSLYKEVCEIEKTKDREGLEVKGLAREKSVMHGEIKELGKIKGILEGEIDSIASSICQNIRDIGQDAALQIQQQLTDIRKQFDDILSSTLKTGEAIGQMRQMVGKGEESEKSLQDFLKETRERLVGS